MSESCPVLTPAERRYLEIQDKAERGMMAAIYGALDEAARQAADDMRSAGLQEEAPAYEYFVAVAHQKLFLSLCGADPETFLGGNAEIAAHIIGNCEKIAGHYWGREAVVTE